MTDFNPVIRQYAEHFKAVRRERAVMLARHKRERLDRTKREAHKGPPARNLNQEARLAALTRLRRNQARMSPREQYDADEARRREQERKTGALYSDQERG